MEFKCNDSKILVLGEVMLDRYCYGRVERICPEAPVPILLHERTEDYIGGAGIVAKTLAALGATPSLLTVVGDDAEGKKLREMSERERIGCLGFMEEKGRKTTIKERFVTESPHFHMLLRMDREEKKRLSEAAESKLLDIFEKKCENAELVVISDYDKGMMSGSIAGKVVEISKRLGKRVIVDSKSGLKKYAGAFLALPNSNELLLEFGEKFSNEDDRIVPAARKMADMLGSHVIVKRGGKGATLMENGKETHCPSYAIKVVNVSGAGDIFVAIVSAAIISGIGLAEAVEMANRGCAAAIAKKHVSVSIEEIMTPPPAW